MFIAIDKDDNRTLVDIAQKGGEYFCPICNAPLIVRDGNLNAKHFAHKKGTCTDAWHYDMSDWHKRMQGYFDERYREVVVKSAKKTHRADVLIDKTVIEFQHSPISSEEFCDRNKFFRDLGYRIAWVFDATDVFENESLFFDPNDDRLMMIWKNPNRVFSTSERITDDSKQYAIWLYWPNPDEDGDWLNKVIWTARDDDGRPCMKRLLVSEYGQQMKSNEMNPDVFFYSKADYFCEELKELKRKFKFEIKYSGEKGKPQNAYVCPKRPNQFGVKVFHETGCAYCRHCYMIAKKERANYTKWAMYCCYPTQVRELCEAHPGYECSGVDIYEI